MSRDQSLHILQHALGLDDYGQGESYRNRYIASEGCDGWFYLLDHVAAGRMVEHAPDALTGGMNCFTVTDAGREYVRANSPTPPRLSRGKRRYRRFLEADSGLKFGEWLKQESGGAP